MEDQEASAAIVADLEDKYRRMLKAKLEKRLKRDVDVSNIKGAGVDEEHLFYELTLDKGNFFGYVFPILRKAVCGREGIRRENDLVYSLAADILRNMGYEVMHDNEMHSALTRT